MKTVMDAVNEFKGEYFDGECGDEDHQNEIVVAKRDFETYRFGDIKIGSGNSANNKYWKVIGTKKEFDDLVQQLETNFGVCKLTYAKYKRAVTKSTKELQVMDEESNQCKISNLGNLLHNMSCSMDNEDEQNEFGGYASFCWDLADELRKSECAADTIKPSQPVFTQAMADNGELPQVGIECNFETTFFTTVTSNRGVCKPIAYHADKVWLDMFDSEYVININVIEFKPIDTRTDKEKAIDEIMLGNIGANTRELLSIVYDKWVGE